MKILKRIYCWWFGHKTRNGADGYNGYSFIWMCSRCEKELYYHDMVCDSLHENVGNSVRYWLFRKWFPVKCSDCGHRYKCDDSKPHIPF